MSKKTENVNQKESQRPKPLERNVSRSAGHWIRSPDTKKEDMIIKGKNARCHHEGLLYLEDKLPGVIWIKRQRKTGLKPDTDTADMYWVFKFNDIVVNGAKVGICDDQGSRCVLYGGGMDSADVSGENPQSICKCFGPSITSGDEIGLCLSFPPPLLNIEKPLDIENIKNIKNNENTSKIQLYIYVNGQCLGLGTEVKQSDYSEAVRPIVLFSAHFSQGKGSVTIEPSRTAPTDRKRAAHIKYAGLEGHWKIKKAEGSFTLKGPKGRPKPMQRNREVMEAKMVFKSADENHYEHYAYSCDGDHHTYIAIINNGTSWKPVTDLRPRGVFSRLTREAWDRPTGGDFNSLLQRGGFRNLNSFIVYSKAIQFDPNKFKKEKRKNPKDDPNAPLEFEPTAWLFFLCVLGPDSFHLNETREELTLVVEKRKQTAKVVFVRNHQDPGPCTVP